MTWPAAVDHVRRRGAPGTVPDAPITVNFHPDRLLADGRTVAACLAGDGVYRSQFETRISNGGLLAYPGGDRDRWEHRMFGGAYRGVRGRPVYGALNLAGYPDGAAPRFGSCHLVLARAVLSRATFCHGDSHRGPAAAGTADAFGAVRAALHDQVAREGGALGVRAPAVAAWEAAVAERRAAARRILGCGFADRRMADGHASDGQGSDVHGSDGHGSDGWDGGGGPPAVVAPGRTLDDYVEAQVHGGLVLGEDVTAIVVCPSLRGTATVAHLGSLGVPTHWHAGFALPAEEFPAGLRGPAVPPLAREIAARYRQDVLDAEVIGRAARAAADDPECLQQIKYLWHILVLLGRPHAGG